MSARTRQDERICSGGIVEDDSIAAASYHNLPPHCPELANFLAHQQQQQQQQHQQHLLQQQGQAGPLMWPPPAHLGVQFQQHHPHPHPHAQHHHQPQPQPTQSSHVYNDYLYNLAYSAPQGPPETYSVLPVGHGNFLKVYHSTENAVNDVYAQQAAAAAVNFSHINMASLSQHPSQAQVQAQAQAQAQVQAQVQAQATSAQQTPPVQTQLYELFATNPQLPLPEMNIALQQQQQQQQHQQQQKKQQQPQPQQQPQSPRFHQIDDSAATAAGVSSGVAPSNSCNMFINNLVNNWSPNLTDASYVQFTGEAPERVCNYNESSTKVSATTAAAPQPVAVPPQPLSPVKVPQQQEQSEYQAQVLQAKSVETSQKEVNANPTPATASPPPTKTQSIVAAAASTAATAINKKANITPGMPEGKKRIVAEVKPMPMSYSDVLSKGSSLRNSSVASISTSGETRTTNNLENGHASQRRQGKEDGNGNSNGNGNGNREVRSNAKRSPLHELKDLPGSGGNGMSHRSKKRQQSGNQGISQKQQPLTQQQQQQQTQATVKSGKPTQEKKRPANLKLNNNNNSNVNGYGTKAFDSKGSSSNSGNVNSTNAATGSNSSGSSQNFSTRKSNNNNNRHSSNSNSSNTNYSNGNSNNGSNSSNSNHHHGSNSGGSNSNANSSSSKRYSSSSNVNLNSNSGSYSYSSKRNRSSGYGSSNSPAHSITSNRNYELAKRIGHTWWIYTLKLLTWLFYLVYDIVVLGCSMAYERLTTAYVAGVAYARQLHKELKQNSGKPSIWWRNYWRRFDARFKKNSRWAFWRRFYKRKPPEASTEAFKTGRLPQTGEEAMYSLLNCKGKDAYRYVPIVIFI